MDCGWLKLNNVSYFTRLSITEWKLRALNTSTSAMELIPQYSTATIACNFA
jgi:hypothetical protein